MITTYIIKRRSDSAYLSSIWYDHGFNHIVQYWSPVVSDAFPYSSREAALDVVDGVTEDQFDIIAQTLQDDDTWVQQVDNDQPL